MAVFVNSYPSDNKFPGLEILIITDSRGRHLDLHLSSLLKSNFRMVVCSGANLIDSIERSRSHLSDTTSSQVYCLAGICGLTYKDKITKKVTPRYSNMETAARCYSIVLEEAYNRLRGYLVNPSTVR